ncbi:hypothetical protein Q9966_000460 [Columba livia]|nr:hypothetical protein Q9966_000460 [Columba livia]
MDFLACTRVLVFQYWESLCTKPPILDATPPLSTLCSSEYITEEPTHFTEGLATEMIGIILDWAISMTLKHANKSLMKYFKSLAYPAYDLSSNW